MRKKKMAIIGTAGVQANYGGFETLIENLSYELEAKVDITVYCAGKKIKKDDKLKHYKGASLIYLPFKASAAQSILYNFLSILHAVFYADILLIQSVSGGLLLPFIKVFTNKKIIVSIDGIEWKSDKWNKWMRWYLWVAEWAAIKFSHANVTNNESVQDYIAARYGVLSNMIGYGADHIAYVQPEEADLIKYPFLSTAYIIEECLIEPEYNVDMILASFAGMTDHNLVITGNWGSSRYSRELKKKYSDYPNLFLLDTVSDRRTAAMLKSNAATYIHGHRSGGITPSLAEAMQLQRPVIAYGTACNIMATGNKALYFKTGSDLAMIMSKERKAQLATNGEDMKAMAARKYTWKAMAHKYHLLLKAVCYEPTGRYLQSRIAMQLNAQCLQQRGLSHLGAATLFYEKR